MSLKLSRRAFAAAALLASRAALAAPFLQPQVARVIIDNDFAGDPDGLFQLAHHLACRSVQIPLIIGSHLPGAFGSRHDARDAAQRATELIDLMGLKGKHTPVAGAEAPLASRQSWAASPATAAIVREAMRADTSVPLVYAAGAGLTELALAWLAEPRIGKRLKLIWIGGTSHPGAADPSAGGHEREFNFSIDPIAAQIVFNESDIEIWQVPSGTYRTMLFGAGELDEVGRYGPLGAYLKAAVDRVPEFLAKATGKPPLPMTEAYVLGDSPLVTLSALVDPFGGEPSSSRYTSVPTPLLNADGSYSPRPDGRRMRVYTSIDSGLTFRDMMAKFRMLGSTSARAPG